MHPYTARDVERLVNLPRSRIRSLVEAGFVSPERGPRNEWLFSFQDLIVLRTAQALARAKVPHKRIITSVKELRRRLPESMPLSGLNIAADADHVVVREGARSWRAESGQYLLGFEGDPAAGSLSVLERQEAGRVAEAKPAVTARPAVRAQGTADADRARFAATAHPARIPANAEQWYQRGVDLEPDDPDAAIAAYERALAADPGLLKARLNLGCLLHERGRLERAEKVYREAMPVDGTDPVLLYDLGILLEDMGRKKEAMQAYKASLREDPGFADCHYNLALVCEALGQRKDAIQHLAAYRRLTAPSRSE